MLLDQQTLAETVTWCTMSRAVRQHFRSEELDPAEEFPICLENESTIDFVAYELMIERMRMMQVLKVSTRRRGLLHGVVRGDWHEVAQEGRVLFFDCSNSMRDGLAEGETDYFDVQNVPAWDTWVQYLSNLSEPEMRASNVWKGPVDSLICWVPQSLIDSVSRGINVNAEGCLCWADDEHVAHLPIAQELRAMGLA